MFGWGGSSYANYDDPLAKERDAPPEPCSIQFPEYYPALKATSLTPQKHTDLKKLLMGIKNPTEITSKHIEAFNIKYRSNTAVSDLVPALPEGLIEEATLKLIVKDEFSLQNDPCFRKVCRLPPEQGQTLPRLAQSYLFYKSLEDMSRYWDNSKDRYFEKAEDVASFQNADDERRSSIQKENIKPTTDADGDVHMTNSTRALNQAQPAKPQSTQMLYTGRRNGNASTMPPGMRDGILEGLLRAATQKFNAVCKPPTQQYTRLQVGELLIPVRQTFVVGRVPTDRVEARKGKTCGPLLVGSTRHEVVFRKENEKIGKGQGEIADLLRELGGLLLLAQQRNRQGCTEIKPGSGEKCWWANKQRWGGGKGGDMPHEEIERPEEFPKVEEDVVMEDLPNGHTRTRRSHDLSAESGAPSMPSKLVASDFPPGKIVPSGYISGRPFPAATAPTPESATLTRPERPPMSTRRIKAMCEAWKLLKPPSSLWDTNVTFKAIGKSDGPNGEWDDVFMVSCVNSHVSILKMRASKGYITWLERGEMSEVAKERKAGRSGISLPVKEERDWDGVEMSREVLYLERSQWWDMFVPEERSEALRAIWGMLSWLNREVGGGKLPWAVE